MTFAETKARKLERKPVLRVFNALGMVAWVNEHDEASQRLRLLHPITWFWVTAMFVYGIIAQGVPETIRDIKYSLKHNCVWF